MVVGIGLNVGWAPAGRGAARSGHRSVGSPDRIARRAAVTRRGNLTTANELLDTLGRRVRVELPSGELVGRAVDVDRDGSLAVIDACAITHHIDAGDVVHLRDV